MAKTKKAPEAPATSRVRIRYRDATELSGALSALAKEVRLPMEVAMRVALMRRTADAAKEAWQSEKGKLLRDFQKKAKGKSGDAEQEAIMAYQEAVKAAAAETFEVSGAISYDVIADGVGEEAPENLGNILAGLLPVLVDVPE